MRTLLLTLAAVASLSMPSYAQTDELLEPKRIVYFELGGNALFSVNVEDVIADKLTARFGGMLVPGAAIATITVNKLFGARNQYFVLGLGATVGAGETEFKAATATATIGYRYMRSSGLFFQLASTPFFTRSATQGWSGISVGKSF